MNYRSTVYGCTVISAVNQPSLPHSPLGGLQCALQMMHLALAVTLLIFLFLIWGCGPQGSALGCSSGLWTKGTEVPTPVGL
jgi:hypothetical protein